MINLHRRTKTNSLSSLILVFSIVHLISAGEARKHTEQDVGKVNSNVENLGWQEVFFREINQRTKLANLASLRDTDMDCNDLELRVWIGFGPVALKGFVINRRASEWSAIYLRSINPSVARSDYQKRLGTPKSGWNVLWKRLVGNDLLALTGTKQRSGWVDGESFVVEIKTAGSYKTYMYDNPELSKDPGGMKMLEIVRIVRDEFDIEK